MNHASREMLGRINILDDAKFSCQLLASVISFNLQSKFFAEKHSLVQALILLWFLATSSMIRTVKHQLFMNIYCHSADTLSRTLWKWRRGS